MPPTRRQLRDTEKRFARIRNDAIAAVEQTREVMHRVRNDAQRRANRRALDKAGKR